jgi:formylglycine-generating enzyme required for sulfatase activity
MRVWLRLSWLAPLAAPVVALSGCVDFAQLGDNPDRFAKLPPSGCVPECTTGYVCASDEFVCNVRAPDVTTAGTSAGLSGAGLSDCGPQLAEKCGSSALVPGGEIVRTLGRTQHPATVSSVRIDRYEVTVGRFRRFVDAWVREGWRPASGSGKHAHLASGKGLFVVGAAQESGWDAASTAYVGARSVDADKPSTSGATTAADWNAALACDTSSSARLATWTTAAGETDRRPQNCLSWYDLQAFCIWDGGFVPTEAEWQYAAAGGDEKRVYPWGGTGPGRESAYAVYGCLFGGSGTCFGAENLPAVGTAPRGLGRWSHVDFAGSLAEWVLDAYGTSGLIYPAVCTDCVAIAADGTAVVRGGGFNEAVANLSTSFRAGVKRARRSVSLGGRCARVP